MSKLAEKIKRVTRVTPQPLGFGTSRNMAEASMVLAGIARDASGAAELARRGADVVVIGSASSPAEKGAAKSAGELIAGAYIAGKADAEAEAYREGGFDFVVFDPNTSSATALLDEKIGYVLVLPSDLSDNEVRTLEAFSIDAIDVGPIEGALTVRRQIDLRRIYATARKPLMVHVNAAISSTELQALRDTNVVVVAVEGADGVERLRKAIDALPARVHRKDSEDRPTPLVPHNAMVEGDDEDEHEHD